MPRLPFFLFLLLTAFSACRQSAPLSEQISTSTTKASTALRSAPDQLFGELFRQVQMQQIFEDGKTFVDCSPRQPAETIMAAYETAAKQTDFDLAAFVNQYFDLPAEANTHFEAQAGRNIVDHINALWPVLTRQADADKGDAGSLIPLPHDYIVPGGRFREIYYWDSYFTMLGLKTAKRYDDIRKMVDNFAYLIDELGFIPNGNRTYYLTRSQPPFFAAMISLLVSIDGPAVYGKYLPQLEKEYQWWMKGAAEVSAQQPALLHCVWLPGNRILNRYYDSGDTPRPESYREDTETIAASQRDPATVARHLRSGAESGWDYSSRWLADGQTMESIETTDIIPVDLNALLYHTEQVLELAYLNTQNTEAAASMRNQRYARRAAVQQICWNPQTQWFEDYHWLQGKPTGRLSLAGMYPFFFDLAAEDQAAEAFPILAEKFLAAGGVRSTLVNTGQQWDAPNGWPPLQYISIKGLEKYGEMKLAKAIRDRWLDNNDRVFQNTGKMVEKYNVEDLSLLAGGGEYPVQDGFGWSNGVFLSLDQN